VLDPVLRKRVIDEGLKVYLADNREAWQLDAAGCWSRVKPRRGAKRRSAQSELLAKMREPDDQA
jgi:polyphosphate kinase